ALGTVAHWLLIRALQAAPASLIQPYTFALVLWAVVVGLVGFGDFPDGATVVGAVIVIGSGLFTFYRERLRRDPRAS
ncbi:MAG: EamA/RhaT family transporter, partial [Alphaproteobacteria bacterium]